MALWKLFLSQRNKNKVLLDRQNRRHSVKFYYKKNKTNERKGNENTEKANDEKNFFSCFNTVFDGM